MWTLLLTYGSQRQKIQIDETTCTSSQLYTQAAEKFPVLKKQNASNWQLLCGMPRPQPLDRNSNGILKESKQITNQDRILVREQVDPATSEPAAAATATARRPKRSAAQRATENFSAVIAAQDQLQQQQQQQSKKKKASPKKRKTTPFQAARHSEGRRLHDGAVTSRPKPRKPRQQQSRNNNSNQQNSAELGLLDTLESKSKGGRLMRKGWRKAVESVYEQNQAVARLASLSQGRPQRGAAPNSSSKEVYLEFVEQAQQSNNDDNDDNTQSSSLRVTYPKGLQGRGRYEETVDWLPRDVVKAVVASLHPVNPEALRPSNLALLSPRVFWSLVYHHCCSGRDEDDDDDDDDATARPPAATLQDALLVVGPDLDWSFLRRRREQLSAKALENRRQQQEGSAATNELEAAAAAIASVEDAMAHMFESAENSSQQLNEPVSATEATSRPAASESAPPSSFVIVTPTESDIDELMACIRGEEVNDDDSTSTSCQGAWAKQLQDDHNIPNWRVLANQEAASLAAAWVEKCSAESAAEDHWQSRIEAWIVRAQQETLEEIMVEICHGNIDGVERLRLGARSGTPRDLCVWATIPQALHAAMFGSDNANDGDGGTTTNITVQEVEQWCRNAQRVLEQFSWLKDYVTPVDA